MLESSFRRYNPRNKWLSHRERAWALPDRRTSRSWRYGRGLPRAHGARLNRDVAIKVLPDHLSQNLALPPDSSLVVDFAASMSPDGKRVLMTLTDAGGKPKLWLRSLSSDDAQPLEGTEGGVYPFWSPDSQFIAFYSADGKLRKISAAGGPAESICDLSYGFGNAWGSKGTIVTSEGPWGLF